MDDGHWTIRAYAGPKGELMWAVVHRRSPMFVAVVADRSVDDLRAIPPGAVHWAKDADAADTGPLLREALEAVRSSRSQDPSPADALAVAMNLVGPPGSVPDRHRPRGRTRRAGRA